MDSLKASEELGAKGATHPRVSLDDIESAIASEHIFTAGDAVAALVGQPNDVATHPGSPLSLLTIYILVLHNGFTVIGKSAPASPENFDAAKGATFAREDAIRQLWPLMGFALRDRLHRSKLDDEAFHKAVANQRCASDALTVATGTDDGWQAQHARGRAVELAMGLGPLGHNGRTDVEAMLAAGEKIAAFIQGQPPAPEAPTLAAAGRKMANY